MKMGIDVTIHIVFIATKKYVRESSFSKELQILIKNDITAEMESLKVYFEFSFKCRSSSFMNI